MSEGIRNSGGKGITILKAVIGLILFITLVVYVYNANMNAVPG